MPTPNPHDPVPWPCGPQAWGDVSRHTGVSRPSRPEVESIGDSSLASEWYEARCPPLWPLLIFASESKNGLDDLHGGEVWSPNGQVPDPVTARTLAVLSCLSSREPERIALAHLCIAARRDRRILGTVALIHGTISSLLAAIGWGQLPPKNDQETITERLCVLSNDYFIAELISDKLGMPEFTTGTAPQLPHYPSFVVVVPGWGIQNTINEVVDGIFEAAALTGDSKWKCIVVDDANRVPLCLENRRPEVDILRSEERVYCGGARNLGTISSSSEIVCYCDGDTIMAQNYLTEHLFRQLLSPNLISVSMRESLSEATTVPSRLPHTTEDTRISATYEPGRLGLIPTVAPVRVAALSETCAFRDFGFGRKLGPVDLSFMVKGNNLCVSRTTADVGFPPDFVGYGPEDGVFAAKAISRGCMVVPVLSTGVFHREHKPRAGSLAARDAELIPNLIRQAKHLITPAWKDWKY